MGGRSPRSPKPRSPVSGLRSPVQAHPYFIDKIIQFYECHLVRHSVMFGGPAHEGRLGRCAGVRDSTPRLVGMPFSGKTTALNTLGKASHRGLDRRPTNDVWENPDSTRICRLYAVYRDIVPLYLVYRYSYRYSDGVPVAV